MIRAIHTIMIPGKVLFPGDTVQLDADREDRLIENGFAESVVTSPTLEETGEAASAPAPEKPSEPDEPPSEPEPTDDSDSPRPAAFKKIGRKRRK